MGDVIAKGAFFQEELHLLKKRFPKIISEIRGKGLIVAMELKEKGPAIQSFCQENGLLINCIGEGILRFLPPLNVSRER